MRARRGGGADRSGSADAVLVAAMGGMAERSSGCAGTVTPAVLRASSNAEMGVHLHVACAGLSRGRGTKGKRRRLGRQLVDVAVRAWACASAPIHVYVALA